jgi:hypothetical protein
MVELLLFSLAGRFFEEKLAQKVNKLSSRCLQSLPG